MSSASRLRTLLDCGVTVLCCTPTYALRLAEVAVEEGIDLGPSKVRLILAAGEAGGSIPATRTRIEKAWQGARVFDHHGMTEVGPVSFESPNHPCVLHVIERAYFAEVVHPETGDPVEEGGTGELILTTLLRTGSPLLRYRTGDLVKPFWNREKVYGRPELALEGGILGRADDMVVIRGVNVPPSAVEGILRSRPEVAEFQVEIRDNRGLFEMQILVEPVSREVDAEDLKRAIEGDLRVAFNLRIPVTIVPCGGLPRYEMKSKRWVRHP
jgi:phenylacetate-CoA ligase